MLINKSFILVLLVTIFTHLNSYGQKSETNNYFFKNWNIDSGLPSNTVNSVVKSSEGYLWLGTNNGAVRFDGIKFKVYNSENVALIKCILSDCVIGDGANMKKIISSESIIGDYSILEDLIKKQITIGDSYYITTSNR